MIDAQEARLRAMGELEMVRGDIGALAAILDQVDLWRPAGGLKTVCDEALGMLRQMAERFDRKLVVTLVGPSGAGKSTLLNALAGDDALSPVGHRRPRDYLCRRYQADQVTLRPWQTPAGTLNNSLS